MTDVKYDTVPGQVKLFLKYLVCNGFTWVQGRRELSVTRVEPGRPV